MKISQKKNCKRCYANDGLNNCQLGYNLKLMAYDTHGFSSFGVPLEPCPKPITFGDYKFAMDYYKAKDCRMDG